MSSRNSVAQRPRTSTRPMEGMADVPGVWIVFPENRRRPWLMVRVAKWVVETIHCIIVCGAELAIACWKKVAPVVVDLLPMMIGVAIGPLLVLFFDLLGWI